MFYIYFMIDNKCITFLNIKKYGVEINKNASKIARRNGKTC
jgi:hypothetical protein